MGYRGDDLDLRTPPASGPGSHSAAAQRGGPIWVDETVLACCNHAYDVALAHRASEVRLEHLLHALTRIDAAVGRLEARGIRVSALRRDSGTVIASEIPFDSDNGTPRRSDELEEVLQQAASAAGRRNAPVGVDDLLHVMLDLEPGLKGLELLARHLQAVKPFPERFSYLSDAGYRAYDPGRREPMHTPWSNYLADAGRMGASDPRSPAIDGGHSARLEAMEQMLRALAHDLANERQVVSEILQGLQHDMRAQRDGIDLVSGRLHDGTPASVAGLEQQLRDLVKANASLTDRLSRFEESLEGRLDNVKTVLSADGTPGDLATLTAKLDLIEEAVLSRDVGLPDDFSVQIARKLKEDVGTATGISEILQEGLEPLMVRIESALEGRQSTIAESLTALSDRIGTIETGLDGLPDKLSDVRQAYSKDLSEVHEALMKLNANQHTLADAVSEWRTDSDERLEDMSEKLELVKRLSDTTSKLHRIMVERYYRRNRLWYWLFGTDDWLAASWPSQAARVEEELRAFRCGLRDTR